MNKTENIIFNTSITCPKCGFIKQESMQANACCYFYECKNCKEILKPIKGDCCVFCSFGTVPCPPVQQNKNCC